jgi:hypothetical protein
VSQDNKQQQGSGMNRLVAARSGEATLEFEDKQQVTTSEEEE